MTVRSMKRQGAQRRSGPRWSITVVLATSLLGISACRHGAKGLAPSPDVQALLTQLTKEQRMTAAGRVRARCEGPLAERCACTQTAVQEALDDTLAELARNLLTHDKDACTEPLSGQDAEVQARLGAPDAEKKAQAVLGTRPQDPYATYALAHLAWMKSDRPNATRWADAAVAAGREGPAHLIVGLLALDRGDVEVARGAFVRALDREPADVPALYDLALCDHRLNHYRAAREGYLSVLRKNPKHLDARYNLALLTLNAGFRDEATHHLAELEKIAPTDPRTTRLAAQMDAIAAAPPPSASAVPAAAPAPSASSRRR